MFTGIVQHKSKIIKIEHTGCDKIFYITPFASIQDYQQGESIAINGTCLTLTDFSASGLKMYASPETLSRTNLSQLEIGHTVNVERALKLSDRLGGHFVSGHIDTKAPLIHIDRIGHSACLTFSTDQTISRYLIPKGSIALDGISLTINQCSQGSFSVNIIPETLKRTTITSWSKGYQANVEIDLISKHIYQYITQTKRDLSINQEFLKKYGY